MWVAGQTILLALSLATALSFVLEGSSTSYAQFRKWNAALNGTLEFEFKTEQGNGLLLYTDDGGTYDFFELKLVESALRLRYNLGGGAQIVTVGRELGDARWHKVQITRNVENTSLAVDDVAATSTSRGKEFEFGKLAANSDVYVGGMPSWYNGKLTLLALPSVIFEPRFNGFIRNIVYADDESDVPRRQEMKNKDKECGGQPCVVGVGQRKSPRSLRNTMMTAANVTDACESRDPCQHGGICISTDNGPICECRSGDYEGIYCEKEAWSTVLPTAGAADYWAWDYNKAPSEASFRGTEYLTIDLSKGDPVFSTQESISLQFKTRQSNGLLFYSGQDGDYLVISVKDGGVFVGMTLAKGILELQVKPARLRFDDNQWHKVLVQRQVQELLAVVDGIYSDHGHTAGSFTRLASDRLIVGGGADPRALQGAKGINNFVGCLRKVEFAAKDVKMELIEAARNGAMGVSAWGKLEFHCREPRASDPITFTTRDSHLVLPQWKATESGSISFRIRTNEPNGLIIYSKSGASTRTDLFAFEIMDGHLYAHIDLGSGPIKVKASKKRVDDGKWHDVSLRRNRKEGRVTVDDNPTEFITPGDSTELDLDGLLYIGGVGAPFAPLTVPAVLWTGTLRQGYVGCLRDLVINGKPVDIAGYAQQQDSGAVRPACHAQQPHCTSQPCMHDGLCVEGWNRFHCDCTGTPFTGPTCGKDASTLYVNGSQQLTALMPEDSQTQAEEVVVRFRTTRPLGLLLATSLENSVDKLQISLEDAKAKLLLRIGDREKTMYTGQGLNDDMWHTVKFSRRLRSLRFQVDDDPAKEMEAPLMNRTLRFRTLLIGGYLHAGEDVPHFVGQLQQVWFNGYPYLEIARSAGSHQSSHQGVTPIIKVTGKFEKRNHPVHHPVTFTSQHTFVGLPVLKAYVETNIYFQFKTREPNGLILYNAGRERDFISIELVNGHIHYIFDLGDGPVKIKDNLKTRLNDGKWHSVAIGRPAPKRHTLAVDDHLISVTSAGSNENLDLDRILYIGGVEKSEYTQLPKHILSRHGFEGCLASLDLSGESPDLISDAVVPSRLVKSGCDASANMHPGKKCTHDVCANHGVCVQQWDSYTCDCDMTSFIGPACSDEAVSYEFGAGKGLITYTFPAERKPEMKRDTIAMGIVTGISDAALLRIDSATTDDYLEIEIVEGNVFAVYNMGTNDHPIGEVGVKVNDNQYHVIRFTRTGANSTLQIDDYNLQVNHPTGHQLTVFNHQSTIQVGGRWNGSKGRIERPFLGIISGLVVNGARILELAAAKDGRITTRSDVQLLPVGSLVDKAAPLQKMQQTPASGYPGVMDDLIFSGAGSGCAGDDEDEECTPIYEKSDDLITPVYVAPTRSPITIKHKSHKETVPERPSCDDEEECEEGSGDSGTTEQMFVTTATDSSSVTYTTQREISTSHISSQTSPGSTSTRSGVVTITTPHNVSTIGTEYTHTHPHTHGSTDVTHGILTSETSHTSTTEVTDPPPPPPPPPVYPPVPLPPRTTNNKRITSEASEIASLIIGIIAAALIAIVLISIIIIKFKNRPETNYKIDEGKTFCQDPNAALLDSAAGPGQPYAGSVKNGANVGKNGKKRELKDIKEWYV